MLLQLQKERLSFAWDQPISTAAGTGKRGTQKSIRIVGMEKIKWKRLPIKIIALVKCHHV